jgi:hypothetical protein
VSQSGNIILSGGGAGGSTQVEGRAANNTALVGNPVRIGISDGTNIQDFAQATLASFLATLTGAIKVVAYSYIDGANSRFATPQTANNMSDANAGTFVGTQAQAIYNGATFDRLRGGSPSADPGNAGILVAAPVLSDGTNFRNWRTASVTADGNSAAQIPATVGYVFNESTFDRVRNNRGLTVFASAARTSTTNSADQVNYNGVGALFFLDISAVSGTLPTLDLKIQVKDPTSGNYVDLPNAAFAQKNATGTSMLVVYPGITTAANAAVSGILARLFRAVATIGGTTPSFTFTLSAVIVTA